MLEIMSHNIISSTEMKMLGDCLHVCPCMQRIHAPQESDIFMSVHVQHARTPYTHLHNREIMDMKGILDRI